MFEIPKILVNYQLHLQENIHGIAFRQFPIKVNVIYPNEVDHDFAANPVLLVPVKIQVKNLYNINPISLQFEAVNLDEGYRNAFDLNCKFFVWEGQTEQDIYDLKFNEIAELNLQATFYGPGLYDLNRFKFTFYKHRDDERLVPPKEAVSILQVQSVINPIRPIPLFSQEKEIYNIKVNGK